MNCTVTTTATGGKCGKIAARTFEGTCGETFAECAEHVEKPVERIGVAVTHEVGDEVEIHRYGKTYLGHVVEVGKRGAIYAEFIYGNGARRRVRV